MNPIEHLKNVNTVLLFFLLVGTLLFGGYLMMRSKKPITTIHVAIDSARINKK